VTPARLHCKVRGRGPDVAFIHGFAANSAVWSPLAAQLGVGVRMHAFDLPGHGRSPHRGWPGADVGAVAEAVAGEVPPDTLWVGWSLGAQVALAAAHAGVPMRGMVLIGATPRFVNGAGWASGSPAADWQAFRESARLRPELLLQRFFGLCGQPGPGGRLVARALRAALEDGGAPQPAGLELALDLLQANDLRALVDGIEVPALVLHGTSDRVVPSAAGRWLAAHLPRARFVPLRGAGHAPLLGPPATVVAQAISEWPSAA